ncbi:MAG: TATA-box-binding protein [Nanoarchaeales archaeon]|nr:TATA-box-binding protein [Nanoarchaeales archaeon]
MALAKTKIVNIVISTSLDHKIPLERLIMDLPNTEYNPEQFPGLIMKIREPKASFLIFSSGKVVCTGTKSLDEVELALEKLVEYMAKVDITITIKPKVRVENVVASSDIDMKLDLNELAIKLSNVEYEPEQFPGLVFKIRDETNATFLIFGNGKIVCTGTKSDKDVHIAIKNLLVILKSAGIKNYKTKEDSEIEEKKLLEKKNKK